MEEKRTLSDADIADLHTQYYNLTADLKQYRQLQWSRDFRKALPEQQKIIKSQYRFFKSALNGTLETLISQGKLQINAAIDALFNRFVSLKCKWAVSKYLRNYKSNK